MQLLSEGKRLQVAHLRIVEIEYGEVAEAPEWPEIGHSRLAELEMAEAGKVRKRTQVDHGRTSNGERG